MKKLFSLSVTCVLLILLVFALSACQGTTPTENPTTDSVTDQTTPESTAPEKTESGAKETEATESKESTTEVIVTEATEATTAETETETETEPEPDVSGGLSMPAIFADGMVLQRQMPIGIFGYADSGSKITVTLGNTTLSTTAKNGEWKIDLPAMEAARGLTLSVKCGAESLTFENVDVGEVLVVSGQSNAQYSAEKLEDWDDLANLADTYKNIRLFVEPSKHEIVPNQYGYGVWIEGTRASIESRTTPQATRDNISAVGYTMALRLAEELGPDITISVINVARSGSPIVAWLPADQITNKSEKTLYKNYLNFWNENGRWPANSSECASYRGGQVYTFCPTVSYNTMIAPLNGYTARGVVWYQGESDTGSRNLYAEKFAALQRTYRKAFNNDELAFFVIQIAPYNAGVQNLAEFEALQYDLTIKDKNTYLISTGIDGTPFHTMDLYFGSAPEVIHPSRKSPLGMRVANKILEELLGVSDGVMSAPELVSVSVKDDTVVLKFDTELRLLYGITPTDFEIYDSKTSAWVKVAASISSKNSIILDTKGYTPTQVRYGFGGRFIELATGELLRLDVGSSLSMGAGNKSFIYKGADGQTYEFFPEDGQVVRTIKSGNVTNASGEPLPTFKVTVD